MYRSIDTDIMIRGTILAIVEMLFPGGAPSLKEYSRESGAAPSTFRRTASWLLGLLPGLFRGRKPGPRESKEADSEAQGRREALEKLSDLRLWLKENRSETQKNNCYSPEAKQRIASLAEEIHSGGRLSLEEIAEVLAMSERQLLRIRTEVREAQGAAPQPQSRRPRTTGELSGKIQELISEIKRSEDTRSPYNATDVTRILKKNYKKELLEHHGSDSISATTVRKYLGEEGEESEKEKKAEHPRGNYLYPEPFQQVAIDTSHFKLFARTFYIITIFEFSGRLNLLTRVFLCEDTARVVCALEEYLERFPGVSAMVIDRGKPYINEEVKRLLEEHGQLRVVCPPETPTAKAAAERHFLTLKEAIRPAVEKVCPKDPLWEPEKMAKALELAAAVFQPLYHQIPQEGIDGKSPAERIEAFDPARAAACMVKLLEREKDSEPSEEYAREIHRLFQLPESEQETVKELRRYSTRTLRLAVKEVSSYMGPPCPDWVYDALGLISAKARKISKKQQYELACQLYHEELTKKDLEEKKRREEELEREAREQEEHPERSVDDVLELLVSCVQGGFVAGVRSVKRHLAELFGFLSRKLGCAFSSEIKRIKCRIGSFSENSRVREEAARIVDELATVAAEAAPAGSNS